MLFLQNIHYLDNYGDVDQNLFYKTFYMQNIGKNKASQLTLWQP